MATPWNPDSGEGEKRENEWVLTSHRTLYLCCFPEADAFVSIG